MVAKFLDDNERKRHLKSGFALFETLFDSCCFANIGPVYMEAGVILQPRHPGVPFVKIIECSLNT